MMMMKPCLDKIRPGTATNETQGKQFSLSFALILRQHHYCSANGKGFLS